MIVANVIEVVSQAYDIEGRTVSIITRVGVGLYPTHGWDAVTPRERGPGLARGQARGQNAFRIFEAHRALRLISARAGSLRDRRRRWKLYLPLCSLCAAAAGAAACSSSSDVPLQDSSQSGQTEIITSATEYVVGEVGQRREFWLVATIRNRTGEPITLFRCGRESSLSKLLRRTNGGWEEAHSYACTDRGPFELAPGASVRDSALIAVGPGDGSPVWLGLKELPATFRATYVVFKGAWPPPSPAASALDSAMSNEFRIIPPS